MLPGIKIYNTLSRTYEEFRTIEPNIVKMYVCGPTVYDYNHIGHGKPYVVYDAMKRYFSLRGYHVVHVMNITDIDDKIIRRAQSEKRSWREIVDEFTKDYLESLEKLNVHVDLHPRVTDHIGEIIGFIEKLISKGYAYVAPSGSVYFEVDKYPDYGELSGRLDRSLWSQEQEFLGEKKKPYDFALWKAAKPGEPSWDSPWGPGRPGWHIECSVMSTRYLGEQFDIHGGGTDLIFPHHENERAQSEAALGVKPWVRYWVHVGMVEISGEKMSKSLGNIITLREAFKKWSPEALRLWYLTGHYRKPLVFSDEALAQAAKFYDRLVSSLQLLGKLIHEAIDMHYMSEEDISIFRKLLSIRSQFHQALSSDFNTPLALAAVRKLTNLVFKELQYRPKYMLIWTAHHIFKEFNVVLGVLDRYFARTPEELETMVESLVKIIVDVRTRLRDRREYELSDFIREELSRIGIVLMDKGRETTWMIRR